MKPEKDRLAVTLRSVYLKAYHNRADWGAVAAYVLRYFVRKPKPIKCFSCVDEGRMIVRTPCGWASKPCTCAAGRKLKYVSEQFRKGDKKSQKKVGKK